MSSWVKVTRGRMPKPVPNGGSRNGPGRIPFLLNIKPYRPFRQTPYPVRKERKEGYGEEYEDMQSFEELLEQQHDYSSATEDSYERYQYSQNASKNYTQADKRSSLYQQFYKQIQEEYDKQRPADCVVLSVTKQQTDYAKSIGHCLQDRGLVVEMIYLQSESGLTRALQDVRSDGSAFCILIEQTNVALSSCTVIIFYESLKIHRNMPSDRAMEFVTAEFGRVHAERQEKEREEIAVKAADLADDYLEREKCDKHAVPLSTRHLLFLLGEGKHLYGEELSTLAEYIRSRQEELQGPPPETDSSSYLGMRKLLPSGLSKPPPLLPTPGRPPLLEHPGHPQGKQAPLLPTPAGPYPKTKPPPLLSMQGRQGPPHGAPLPPQKRLLMGDKPGLLPIPGGPSRPNMPRR
ncbi:nuclear receptor coactivator 5 isoform X3 [Lepisosteus oculatus]|uniref:nuclear receptor coactivator 5 isoform X3 n=1 Tax=Lepisosteus oculatus TaxID=7918 RepID=UPI00073FCD9C|nr:PREDICTED: nuclear receptor coactivator 5-like isoform X3 [Lepisosteus oculatus]